MSSPITLHSLYAALGTTRTELELLISRIGDGTAYLSHTSRGHQIYKPLARWDNCAKGLRVFLIKHADYNAPPCVYGFVKGGSTFANAKMHLDKDCVLRTDIRRFFPSISGERISSSLTERNFKPSLAAMIANLVTVNDGLAIGLSASPFLSNLVMTATDHDLMQYAQQRGLTFTRYADDLIFSGTVDDSVAVDVTAVLNKHNWDVNPAKTAFMRRGGPQYVTGLYVGRKDRPHVPRSLKRSMRWMVHMIERVGYETYMSEFGGSNLGHYHNHLIGWVRYIASIEPRHGIPLIHRIEAAVPDLEYDENDEQLYEYLNGYCW